MGNLIQNNGDEIQERLEQEAREKRDKARKQLADGLDPAQERKLYQLSNLTIHINTHHQ